MELPLHHDPSSLKPWPGDDDRNEAIRRRAEEIYEQSGRIPGRDIENWTQAEKEFAVESAEPTKKAVVVKVAGVQYIAEYDWNSSTGYTPGEFAPGAPVPVRFSGGKMYLRLANGSELEARIVKRVR